MAALPANWALVESQRFWSGPASAMLGGGATSTNTSSKDGAHTPLEIVQRKAYVLPSTRPEIVVLGSVVSAIVIMGPAVCVQAPMPTVGALAASVADVTVQRN